MSADRATSKAAITVKADGYVKQREIDRSLQGALRRHGFDDLRQVEDCPVRFDFSEASWFDLSTLLWLIPVFSRLRRQANVLELRLPPRPVNEDSIRRAAAPARAQLQLNENLWSALQRWDFFDVLARCVDEPLNLLPPDLHAALRKQSRYSRSERLDAASGELVGTPTGRLLELSVVDLGPNEQASIDGAVANYNTDLVRNNLRFHTRWDETEIDDFTTIAVPHAVRNLVHAHGSFAIVASRADERYLHFCVADNGIGIPNLLRQALRDQTLARKDDSELIQYFAGAELLEKTLRGQIEEEYEDSAFVLASTERGVTSDTTKSGFGLFYLKQLVLEKLGELRIRSGKAMVTFDARGKGRRAALPQAEDGLLESPGTSVRIMLPRHADAPRSR